MTDRLQIDLIVRRIKAEPAKGTSLEEIYDIIFDMIESQRLVELAERRRETRQAGHNPSLPLRCRTAPGKR